MLLVRSGTAIEAPVVGRAGVGSSLGLRRGEGCLGLRRRAVWVETVRLVFGRLLLFSLLECEARGEVLLVVVDSSGSISTTSVSRQFRLSLMGSDGLLTVVVAVVVVVLVKEVVCSLA